MKVLYLDESGNHDVNTINPAFPVFAIGGAIVERSYEREVIGPEMDQFKVEHFGTKDVVLHTIDMKRGRGLYGFLADPVKREHFYTGLNGLLSNWEYKVVVCVFEKQRFFQQYSNPADLYHYGLEHLIERFCHELGNELDGGCIYAEKRNKGLDRQLIATWNKLVEGSWGTDYSRPETIEERIVGMELRGKNPRFHGLQLADLVVTPPARHIAGRPVSPNEVQWSVVETKLRRHRGTYDGAGLIIRPRRVS